MFLDNEHGLLHVHIPKTAGSSIQAAIRVHTNDFAQHIPRMHLPANKIRTMVGEHRWDFYYKFAVVRNPFEWYVSMWKFLMPLDGHLFRDKFWAKLTLDDRIALQQHFINGSLDQWLSDFEWTHMTPDLKTSVNRCSQLDWVTDDVELWDIHNLEGLKETIHAKTGVALSIPNINITTNYGDYRQYYTPESMAYVANLNKSLIECMGYTFDSIDRVAA